MGRQVFFYKMDVHQNASKKNLSTKWFSSVDAAYHFP